MGDWTDADGQRLSAELRKPGRMERLMQMARWFVMAHPRYGREIYDEAKDLLADAIDNVRRSKPWIPNREGKRKSFLVHMHDVMRQILVERDRSARGQREVVDSDFVHDDMLTDPVPLPDQQLHAARKLHWLRMMDHILFEQIEESDPVAAQSLVLGKTGMSHADQAAEIGCSVRDIERAQERLLSKGARVREAWEKREAIRMREVREKAARQAAKDKKEKQFAPEDDQ